MVKKGSGVKTDQGKVVRNGTPKTVSTGGACDGGGSSELAKAAKAIHSGNKKGGLPGV